MEKRRNKRKLVHVQCFVFAFTIDTVQLAARSAYGNQQTFLSVSTTETPKNVSEMVFLKTAATFFFVRCDEITLILFFFLSDAKWYTQFMRAGLNRFFLVSLAQSLCRRLWVEYHFFLIVMISWWLRAASNHCRFHVICSLCFFLSCFSLLFSQYSRCK